MLGLTGATTQRYDLEALQNVKAVQGGDDHDDKTGDDKMMVPKNIMSILTSKNPHVEVQEELPDAEQDTEVKEEVEVEAMH